MLERLAKASVSARGAALALLALLLAVGAWAASTLPIDALPDVSTVQVSVLTKAPGLSPLEIERTVSVPIENALNGVPGQAEIRSVSRAGLSAVTIVFHDDSDVWFARQLIIERLRALDGVLPPGAEQPQLAPVSTGLGEIYQFVVRSKLHSAMQLRTLLDWEIVPRLRGVPGVIEVNTQGGYLKQFQVVIDPDRIKAFHIPLAEVADALRAANLNVGGGRLERQGESYTLLGQGLLKDRAEIGEVVLRVAADGTPVLVKNVAEVRVGAALRYGTITYNGEGEAVTATVLMLLGANSRDVVRAVAERVAEIRRELPAGVHIDVVYDRADFVGRTLGTVVHNLIEGVLIVTVVLALFLGSLRGALAVVLGIPASMSIALLGMHLFHVTGDLMSLGAIDFGFLVDGPIVILEAVIAGVAGQTLGAGAKGEAYAKLTARVVRPVAYAVAIIMLVYIPLLALQGVEGKMFRPMALTMASALFGALVYAVAFFPAVMRTLVPVPSGHGPAWINRLADPYRRSLRRIVQGRWPLLVAAALLLAATTWRFGRAGADFVPRIFEGDAVVTIRRAPGISLLGAQDLDLAAEKVLLSFPEVKSALAMTGRAEVATDPVGNDNTDILVALAPPERWTSAHDFDDLSVRIKDRVETQVPGTFVSVSQPIEDKMNELISGSRADVQINISGGSLEVLARLATVIGKQIARIRGTGDVRVERILGQPAISARVDRAAMARYGVRSSEALAVIAAAREGVNVGTIYEGERRFDLRVVTPLGEPTAAALGGLFVEAGAGRAIPLREVVMLKEGDGVVAIRREDRARTVRVDVNLRGRDLVSWVAEARATIAREVALPSGYRIGWGGQFENFERAKERLKVVVPVAVLLIFAMLLLMFQDVRLAVAVFLTIPFALTGGMLGLLARGYPFSLSAAVGFIALGGIAVLNGVVIATELRRQLDAGHDVLSAIQRASSTGFRAVLTTAAVASFGFLPMAYATTAGAEVQRPLATVVIVGILVGTVVTLTVLPGILWIVTRPRSSGPTPS
ncbi:MAG TPA: CusA/CzcA family heavy metal efflux RND transporter [Polyangia bacterium]